MLSTLIAENVRQLEFGYRVNLARLRSKLTDFRRLFGQKIFTMADITAFSAEKWSHSVVYWKMFEDVKIF